MKTRLIFFLLPVAFYAINVDLGFAQCTHYQIDYQAGLEKLKVKDYGGAFNDFVAAVNDCPDSLDRVWKMVPRLFRENDRLKHQAQQAKDSIAGLNGTLIAKNVELDSVIKATIEQKDRIEFLTQEKYRLEIEILIEERENRKKMEKLPYGPQRTIFLASEDKGTNKNYFYINVDGKRLSYLGDWNVAQQFQDDGFAHVRNDTSDFILDTTGTRYPLFKRKTRGTFEKALAVDWNDEDLRRIPHKVKRMNYVRLLFLNHNKIRKIPKFVEDLKYLEELQIAENDFGHLPKFLGNDSALIRIDAHDNHLHGLKKNISHLPNLRFLNLSKNYLRKLPSGILGAPALQSLDLSHNKIKKIPDDIGRLGNTLEVLDLSFNELDALPKGIENMTRLKVLNLTGNELHKFPEELVKLKELRVLCIGDNNCSNKEVEREEIRGFIFLNMPWCQVFFH